MNAPRARRLRARIARAALALAADAARFTAAFAATVAVGRAAGWGR